MLNPFANITWRIGALIAAAVAALLFIGFSTQTIRIEGVNLWPLKVVGFKQKVATLRLDLDSIKNAQIMAERMAKAEKLRIENEYREQAERTDNEYQSQLAAANSRAESYARRMRVKAPNRKPSGTPAAAQGDGPESSFGPGETAELGEDYIAVSQQDFDILNENTQRLRAAREWALGLNPTTPAK